MKWRIECEIANRHKNLLAIVFGSSRTVPLFPQMGINKEYELVAIRVDDPNRFIDMQKS